MSSQHPDAKKRAVIREAFGEEAFKVMSDRQVAAKLGYSRGLIGSVRREMIASGEHPPYERRKNSRPGAYKPGQSARGGYVYDEQGKTVRISEWERRQEMRTIEKPLARVNSGTTQSEDMSFTELGKYLSISRETARRLCIGGKIPYRKLSPRCCRVSRVDADRYIRSVTHAAT